ncbi:MAG: hypothetical protein H7039_21045 [Bryobacteraceae bacterium]|nr:hypothetical protein [Bryobacteraceae bacterium]
MRRSLIFILSITSGSFGVLWVATAYQETRQLLPRTSLQIMADEARRESRETVTIVAPVATYAKFNGFDDIIVEATVLRARLVAKRGFPAENNNSNVDTALRFEILEFVAGREIPPGSLPDALPEDFRYVGNHEFIAVVPGGSIEIDGVYIESTNSEFDELSIGIEYMVIARFEEGQFARVLYGPSGIFEVSQGQGLTPMNAANNPIAALFRDSEIRSVRDFKSKAFARSIWQPL